MFFNNRAAMPPQITSANVAQFIPTTSYRQHAQRVQQDVSTFLNSNPACQCLIVELNINQQGKNKVF